MPKQHGSASSDTKRTERNGGENYKPYGLQKTQNKEFLIINACYSVTKYYLCRQNNKRSLLGRILRLEVVRSFPNRYLFSYYSNVTLLFSDSCILEIILPCKRPLKGRQKTAFYFFPCNRLFPKWLFKSFLTIKHSWQSENNRKKIYFIIFHSKRSSNFAENPKQEWKYRHDYNEKIIFLLCAMPPILFSEYQGTKPVCGHTTTVENRGYCHHYLRPLPHFA